MGVHLGGEYASAPIFFEGGVIMHLSPPILEEIVTRLL